MLYVEGEHLTSRKGAKIRVINYPFRPNYKKVFHGITSPVKTTAKKYNEKPLKNS